VRHLGDARRAIEKLDVRVPNLESALPELVAAYHKAREIVDAGHGGKPDAAAGKQARRLECETAPVASAAGAVLIGDAMRTKFHLPRPRVGKLFFSLRYQFAFSRRF